MPFIVQYEGIEGMNGKVYARTSDTMGTINDLIPYGDDSFYCLPYIDSFGDTYFSSLQMEIFLPEWERVKDRAETPLQAEAWTQVYQLAKYVAEHPHSFLHFRGD